MERDDEQAEHLIDWVTDFDNPEVAKPRDKPSATKPVRFATRMARSHPAAVPMIAGAGGLAAIAAIIITALSRPIEEETGRGRPGLDDAVPRPTVTVPTPTLEPEHSGRLPATCADLYTPDMHRALAESELEVNSVWTGSRNLPPGSADKDLLILLAGDDALHCFWLDEFGGEESALLTVLTETTEAESQAAITRLTELGLTRREEQGGVRFFFEKRDASNELHGESHFFRDGLWFATRWYGVGQFGYTADMAQAVFG